MNNDQTQLIKHIVNYAATGQIHDDLIPFYDQYGAWHGKSILERYGGSIPNLHVINQSQLPSSRRTLKERHGTRLRTSFVWKGDERMLIKYSAINGSLLVLGNANIHAPCLLHVGGTLYSCTRSNVSLPCLVTVGRNLHIVKTFRVKAPRLSHIGGAANILGTLPPRLTTVGRSLCVYWCFEAEAPLLSAVGRNLVLSKAESVRFPVLTNIGGSFLLTSRMRSIEVPMLESIGGDFFAPSAVSIRSRALRYIGGNVDTTSAKEYFNPRICVGGEWLTYPGDQKAWARNEAARRALKQPDLLL